MKRIIISAITLLFAASVFAQGSDEACLYSQTYYQGTAKALGMGNALGAVGGDMTSICINPAGMGLYRSKEITASIGLLNNLYHSTYYGTTDNANRFRVTLPNVGYVNAKQRSNYRGLRFTQFGIGLTRTNDYNIHTSAKGLNPTSSKIDNYLQRIDGLSPVDIADIFPMDIYPAWETYLIDTLDGYYTSPVPQGGIWQSRETNFKGRSEEWAFAGSANISERLFIGISANLTHIKRQGYKFYEETMPENAHVDTPFNQWNFTEEFSSRAVGLNAKIGFIYHANSWLRFGVAFHSPTIYKFDESWQTETESQIDWITRKYISHESHYEYTFFSPLKWVGCLAFVVSDNGIVSFDAEYTNFGAANFKASDYDYDNTNAEIRSRLGRTFNFRLGTQWYLNGIYLRAGTGYYGSPYGVGKTNGSVKKASVGIGLPVSESITFDFAYELTCGKEQFTLYSVENLEIEPVTQQQFKSNLAITLKIRF